MFRYRYISETSVRHILRTFITYLLVHMRQQKKLALDIAAKIASVNGPYFGKVLCNDFPKTISVDYVIQP